MTFTALRRPFVLYYRYWQIEQTITTTNNRHTVAKENKMADTNEAKVDMNAQAEMPRPLSKCIRTNVDVVVELAVERMEVSKNIAKLERAIEANTSAVSDYHKELWHKQAEAMRAYKDVLGERIKDLIDG